MVPLLEFAENAYNLLQESHPGAQLWISSQSFNETQLDQLYAILQNVPILSFP